ncbi:MAG: hypothetical protein HGB11_13525, partial [Chlorobiales bacterium]|nr:hypothetical protein [Chlorobiales bacterium]
RIASDTLAELKLAVDLTGPVRWLTYWGIFAPTAQGAKISPLNGRFPITIRPAAMLEAAELTQEKVKL